MADGYYVLLTPNTTSTVVRSEINRISNHFGDRWRHEHVVNLRETQTSKLNINSKKVSVNYVFLVYDQNVPRYFWRIVIVTGVLPSRDSEIRGAIVRLKKPIQSTKVPYQTDRAWEQNLRRGAAIISLLKRKYEY